MQAVTFDCYGTLVYHRMGRGRRYRDYLSTVGLSADPWEHRVLYDVFEYYGAAYSPALPEAAKLSFWTEFTRRLFERTRVRPRDAAEPGQHATAIRNIMGPGAFELFEDTLPVLRGLSRRGLRLGVISDWQKGLGHFCQELGIGKYLDVVVTSADVGCDKPDARLFETARSRLDVVAHETLHVGDRVVDVEGAEAAGLAAVLLVREGTPPTVRVPIIASLRELDALV